VVFQKDCGHGWAFDVGGGGLPNPTESTMWGKGSSGAGCYLDGFLTKWEAGTYAWCPRVPT
jgi:hypothetical protein